MKQKLKKTFRFIGKTLLWIVYVMVTVNERDMYLKSQERGMDCINREDVSLLIPHVTIEYTFDPNSKPKRRYLNWKEFRKLHKF
jgi:hypothetical protein